MGCGQGIFFHVYLGRPTPEKQERCNEARIVVKISRDKIWKAENPSRDNLRHFGTFFFFVYLKTENKVNNKIRCKSSVTNTNDKELPLNFCFFFFFSFGQSERERKKELRRLLNFLYSLFRRLFFPFFFITGQAKQEMRRRRAKKNNGPFHLGLCWLHRVARKKKKREIQSNPSSSTSSPEIFCFCFCFFSSLIWYYSYGPSFHLFSWLFS